MSSFPPPLALPISRFAPCSNDSAPSRPRAAAGQGRCQAVSGRGARAPGPASIDLIVPDTSAARRSMIISEPSEAMSLTGSIEDCARCDAAAARTMLCICGMGISMAAAFSCAGRLDLVVKKKKTTLSSPRQRHTNQRTVSATSSASRSRKMARTKARTLPLPPSHQ